MVTREVDADDLEYHVGSFDEFCARTPRAGIDQKAPGKLERVAVGEQLVQVGMGPVRWSKLLVLCVGFHGEVAQLAFVSEQGCHIRANAVIPGRQEPHAGEHSLLRRIPCQPPDRLGKSANKYAVMACTRHDHLTSTNPRRWSGLHFVCTPAIPAGAARCRISREAGARAPRATESRYAWEAGGCLNHLLAPARRLPS
jgi:hypothetical protein